MPTPFFSIIIPTLNEQKYVPLLLKDLATQSFQDFEVIIVDGHSTDQTVAKITEMSASMPHLTIHYSPQRNVCSQRNLGASKALGEWYIFFDADNRLPPYYLLGIKYHLEVSPTAIFTTYLEPDTTKAKDIAIARIANAYVDLNKHYPKPACMESCMGFHHEVFQKIGGFNPEILYAEGTDILTRARKLGFLLSVFKDPAYVYSLRRFRKQGTLSLLRNFSYYQLTQLTQTPVDKNLVQKLYPMKGGDFFDKKKPNQTTLEKILSELTKPRNLKQELNRLIISQLKPKK